MIFLIEYDRSKGLLVSYSPFKDRDRREAEVRRLEAELANKEKGINYETVLLEAATEDHLKRSHQRYFAKASEIIGSNNPLVK